MSNKRPRAPRAAAPLGDILQDVLRVQEGRRADGIERIVTAWRLVAGQELRERTRVAHWAHGEIVVEVDSPPLCAELAQFRGRRLLDHLRRELGNAPHVKKIRFRLGTIR